MPAMYAAPMLSTFERSLPMLSRNAIVTSRIENAHGFTLSISAAETSSGSSHFPSPLTLHNAVLPKLPICSARTTARSDTPATVIHVSFLSTGYGLTFALKRSCIGAPESLSTVTTRSVGPSPAGPCAAGSKTASM